METFEIIKDSPPLPRSTKSISNPNYHKIALTMGKLDTGDAFLYPLNGEKSWTLKNWVKSIEKSLNDKILDKTIRDKNPHRFSSILVKDEKGKETGMKVRRDN